MRRKKEFSGYYDEKTSPYEIAPEMDYPETIIEETAQEKPPTERIINTAFSSTTNPEIDHDKNIPLVPDTAYYFTFDIGKTRQGSIEINIEPLPIQLLPKQAKLKVVLFAFEGEIDITPKRDVGEVQIMPDWSVQVTKQVEKPDLAPTSYDLLKQRLFFLVRTPAKEGEFRLRCNIYHEQTLVQSRLIAVLVSNTKGRLESPVLTSTVEYSMSKSLNPILLTKMGAQTMSVMLNDNGNGTHCFRMFGANDYKKEASFDVGTLQSLIQEARFALRAASWGDEKPWDETKHYQYETGNNVERLREDLVLFAIRGFRFWAKLTQKIAPREDSNDLSDKMLKPGSIEFVIKDKSEAANYMFPAAMIYDYPLDTTLNPKDYKLCPAFIDSLKSNVPLEDTLCFKGDCPSRGKEPLSVICPSGFWGFRHSIGVPLGCDSESINEILYQESPEITVAASTSFPRWPNHCKTLTSIKSGLQWNIAGTTIDTFDELKLTKPHLVYFYCHGGYQGNTPFIKVGPDSEETLIFPDNFLPKKIRWTVPQPIVFVNGCHTVGMDPKLILDFASTFVLSLNASGVIGTEITIFESLACDFAEEWLAQFLVKGESVGDATRKTRLKLLKQKNPLGLVYTPYANSHLHLKKQESHA